MSLQYPERQGRVTVAPCQRPRLFHGMDARTILDYVERVHERTRRIVLLIPPGDIEWAPTPGWFTFGGLVRHLATIERWMYAENAVGRPSRYDGHGPELASGFEAVLALYDRLHAESAAIFGRLNAEALTAKVATPAGAPITLWKWLRAMTEHEAHHRGQLYLMLALRGVPTPPIYGLTSEAVRSMSGRTDAT
jgi:uncharacterized damage-inducible protein DinB